MTTRGRPGIFLLGLPLLFVVVCAGVGSGWGLPGWNGWAPDEISPLDVDRGAKRGFAMGWSGRYPPLHYRTLELVFRASGAPPATERAGDLADLTHRRRLARGVSIAFASGTLVLLLLAGARLARFGGQEASRGELAGLLAASLLAVSPSFVYYAGTANLEAVYLFWVAASVWFVIRLFESQSYLGWCGLAATSGLAVCTKDQAYGLYVLLPIVLLLAWRRSGRPWTAFWSRVAAAVATLLAVASLAFKLPAGWQGLVAHLETIAGPASVPYREFPLSVGGLTELSLVFVWQVVWVLGIPSTFILVLALGRRSRADRRRAGYAHFALLVMAGSYLLTVILPLRYSYARFALPVALVLAVLGAPALAAWLQSGRARSWRLAPAVLVAVGLGWGIVRVVSLEWALQNDSRHTVETEVARLLGERGEDSDRAVCIGTAKRCPRFRHLRQRRVLRNPAQVLETEGVDVIALPAGEEGAGSEALRDLLRAGDLGFVPLERYRMQWPRTLPGRTSARSNFQHIGPDIDVFARPHADASARR